MSSHCNPSVVDDGLVFLYDVEDIQSYKGEPTENIFLNPTFIGTAGTQTSTVTDNWYFSGYTGDSGFKFYNNSTSPFPLKFSNEGSVITTGANDDSTTQNRRFYCNEVLQAGATYTVSAWIYTTKTSGISIAHFEYGGSSLNSGYFSGTSTHPNHVLGEWYYWEDTYTVGADYTSGLIGPVHSGSSDTIVGIQRFQIEKKSHATPFVNGTRSATQGLLDRTGNSTINISNTSFDSNAQMTFDGTDDYINDASFDMGTPTAITLECIIRFNGSLDSADRKVMHYNKTGGTTAVFQLRKGYSASTLMYQAHNGSQWYTMTDTDAIESDTWAHFMITHSGTSAIMYKNGVQSATATMGNLHWTNASNLLIGYRANSEYWKGDIPIMKLYNRALTAAEVLQNFKATKSRFGL